MKICNWQHLWCIYSLFGKLWDKLFTKQMADGWLSRTETWIQDCDSSACSSSLCVALPSCREEPNYVTQTPFILSTFDYLKFDRPGSH